MNFFMAIYMALLFYVLTPGILVTLPPRGGKMIVAATHAIVFSIVYYFTHRFIWMSSTGMYRKESMTTDEPVQAHDKKVIYQ